MPPIRITPPNGQRREMSAAMVALYLHRIRLADTPEALSALAKEIRERFGDDGANPRLMRVIAVKQERAAEGRLR